MKTQFGNINKPFMPQGTIPFAPQVGIAKWYNGNKDRSGYES